jgi:hypothetical protein
MIRVLFGAFFVLHGLVHLLYFGQSARLFELQPGMVWPDGSWIFSRLLSESGVRNLASALLILAAVVFVASGVGLFVEQSWWRPVMVAAAVLSTAIYLLFWDGNLQHLANKGGVGILINIAIMVVVLIFHWPKLDF